jgi:hypothetical protein
VYDDARPARPCGAQAKLDIFRHRHVVKQRIALREIADLPLLRRQPSEDALMRPQRAAVIRGRCSSNEVDKPDQVL